MNRIACLFSLLIATAHVSATHMGTEYVTYEWISESGTEMIGNWRIDPHSYAAGQTVELDTYLTLTIGDSGEVLSDVIVPIVTLSDDRSILFVNDTWVENLISIEFSTDSAGLVTWSAVPLRPREGASYSGTGRFSRVPEAGSSALLLGAGMSLLALVRRACKGGD